jgi:GxxExxY protein
MGDTLPDVEALATAVVQCSFEIHNDVGPGLFESVYESMLEASLVEMGLSVERQKSFSVTYKGLVLADGFRIDLLVERTLIVEVKSVERLAPVHAKQLLTYLRLTKRPLGLLINFGAATFKEGIKRVIDNRSDYQAPPKFHA